MRCGCRRSGQGAALPYARVVKDGSKPLPRVVVDQEVRDALGRLRPRAREAMAVVVGLWPLILVVGLAVALLWSAGLREPTLGQ